MRLLLGLAGIVLWVTTARGADVGDLIKQLKDGDNDGRRAAAKALGEGGADSKAAVPALIGALKDKDLFVRRFSAQALGEIGPDAKTAVPALIAALSDPKKEVQSAAATALGKLGPSGIEMLIRIVKDVSRDPMVRRQAIDSLAGLGVEARSAVPALTALLKMTGGKGKKKMPNDGDLRIDAANALGAIANSSDKEAVNALQALTEKKQNNRALKMAANAALKKIKSNK